MCRGLADAICYGCSSLFAALDNISNAVTDICIELTITMIITVQLEEPGQNLSMPKLESGGRMLNVGS